MDGYGYNLNNKFCDVLRTRIRDYYVECYETFKSLVCIHGEQINQFITLMPLIKSFIIKHLEATTTVNAIISILDTYPKIDAFLRISYVIDADAYEKDIIYFNNNLKIFQKAARQIFYTNTTLGDSKTFYGYVLFCYYPILVERLWKEHRLGIGIFNLQGMERRNKESKNAAKKFYNNKHNVCSQTIN